MLTTFVNNTLCQRKSGGGMLRFLLIVANLIAIPLGASSDRDDPVDRAMLALGLEREEAQAFLASGGSIVMPDYEYEICKIMVESDQVARKNPNVHVYNRAFAKSHYAQLLGYYEKFLKFPPERNWAQLQDVIRKYDSSPEVVTALATMSGNIKRYGVKDAESGVDNIVSLLNRDWHLASNYGLEYLVIQSLRENKDTGGGCHPGYAGRFVRDLLVIMAMVIRTT